VTTSTSDALQIETQAGTVSAHLHLPDGVDPATRSLVVQCHGFSGAKYPGLVAALTRGGFTVLDLDFPNYGHSAGPANEVDPAAQVQVVRDAVAFMTQAGPAPWIALVGSSLGGSVALLAAADEPRVAATVAGCPLASGLRALRKRYPGDDEWHEFQRRVATAPNGEPVFHRYDIVFLPEHLRKELGPDAPMRFNAATARGFLGIDVEAVVDRVVDRPVLLIHAVDDEVVDCDESRRLHQLSDQRFDLRLLPDGNHFIFHREDVARAIATWLVTQRDASTPTNDHEEDG
jgi:pimeloyl-ACP methyl ester carboxylesterase